MPKLELAHARGGRVRDPTNTLQLRKAFRATAKMHLRQWRAAMRLAVVEHNVLGFSLDGQHAFAAPEIRLKAFSSWMQAAGSSILLGSDWARPYIVKAWRAGEHKAVRETGKGHGVDASDTIVELSRVEIEGILGATIQQVSRVAANIIARGTRRYDAVRQLIVAFDKVAQARLVVMCDVLAVKAYNNAKMSTYASAGIRRVGVHAETLPRDRLTVDKKGDEPAYEIEIDDPEQLVGILTAGDDKVCQLCEDWSEDSPYEIDEVYDVYPLHPRCRCAVYPWEDLRFKGDAVDKAPSPEFVETEHPRGYHGWWIEKGVVASRLVTAVKALKSPVYTDRYRRPDVAAMKLNPAAFKHDMFLFSEEHAYPNFRTGELHGEADDRVRTIIDHMKKNLRFMYEHVATAAQKASGMIWYERTNKIASSIATRYGIPLSSAAGVIATLSPQKDWDQNLYLAHAVMEINHSQQNHRWDDKMEEVAQRIWLKPRATETRQSLAIKKAAANIKNKTLGEITDLAEKAMWIRTYDEAHSDRSYTSFDTGEKVVTAAGKPARAAWQSTPAIASALACLESKGDLKVISEALGEKHKVRSFYNNIVAPDAPNGDVTVDTHAVGVALLRPLSGATAAVMHALGTAPQSAKERPPNWEAASKSAITGLSGTYAIYADAYREVADELHILPQQLQAITWQAKRALFEIGAKRKAEVEREWVSYHGGAQSLEQTQQNILTIARRPKEAGEKVEEDD